MSEEEVFNSNAIGDKIISVIKTIYDPEIPVDIYELGLIYDVMVNENFDVKIYRINIDLYPGIQADNDVVILPTIIFYDDGEEVERLQGDMSFTLETTIEELDEVVEEILSSKF